MLRKLRPGDGFQHPEYEILPYCLIPKSRIYADIVGILYYFMIYRRGNHRFNIPVKAEGTRNSSICRSKKSCFGCTENSLLVNLKSTSFPIFKLRNKQKFENQWLEK